MPPPQPEIDADVRRAVWGLLGLAGLCTVLAGVYRNPYLFQDPFGVGLPDVSVDAGTLVLGFQVSAVLCVLWALLIGALGTPSTARALQARWHRWTEAERARPRAVAVAAALAVAYAALRWAANEETIHATLEMVTAGAAKTPFQYRALVPWLARVVTEAVPALPLVGVYVALEAAAAFGVYAAFRHLLRLFVAGEATGRLAALAVFVPLALNYATPHRYNAIYFPYDTPAVAFFTLGLALLLRREWRWFYPVFAVATLNRETTCFLTVAYVLVAVGRERPSVIARHVVAQAALWLAVKAGLHALYLANEPLDQGVGGLFSNQLARSGRVLMAVPGLAYLLLVTMGGAGAVVLLLGRRVRDARLRRLFGVVPLFLAGMVVVGELLEVRIYGELIPLVAVALLLIGSDVAREAARRATSLPDRRAVAA